jgi:hypothetical protein
MVRNKKAFAGVVFNSLIIGLMMLAVFWQVGQFGALGIQNYILDDGLTEAALEELSAAYQGYVQNLMGAAFMMSNVLSIAASVNVVI